MRILIALTALVLPGFLGADPACFPLHTNVLPDSSTIIIHRCQSPEYVKLDAPSDLAALKNRDLKLYLKVKAILDEISSISIDEIPTWLKAKHSAEGGITSMHWLTSYPPKTHVSFELDGTSFSGVISIREFPADIRKWKQQ